MKENLHKQHQLKRGTKVAFIHLLTALFLGNVSDVVAANPAEIARNRSSLMASRINVTGTVRDSKGEPLPGVTVKIKGSKTATSTDVNGVYRINLPAGNETLVFSFLGFKTTEVAVQGRVSLDVALQDETSSLDEVIVTGYGQKKRSEIVGSVATVSGEELQDIPAPNIAAALRGRIAGVSVGQISGKPGASIDLNIRNSTTSQQGSVIGATSEPLYIIDGITVTSDTFDNLDASMIDNLTILKDASAAIYGAAGAKGVVLVTTKRGKEGKPSITYNGYLGVSDAARTPDMLSAYEHAVLLNEGNVIGNKPENTFFSQGDLDYLKTLNNKSWYDELWSASMMQRHNLSISGGSDKITFFAGGSYQNENGNYEGLKVDKYTMRSGLSATILPGLKADVNFNVDNTIRKANNDLGKEDDEGFFKSIITVPGWVPISIGGKPVDFGTNPLALLNSGYYDNRETQGYRINASLNYQPAALKGFSAKFQISQGGTSDKTRLYKAPYNEYAFEMTGNNNRFYTDRPAILTDSVVSVVNMGNAETRAGQTRGNSYQGFLTLQYAKTLGLHTFDLTVGGEQTVSYNELQANVWVGQLVPDVEDPWAFDINKTQNPQRTVTESTKRSFFGRFNYDIDKKYLLEAVGRLDASSNFAAGNRWGFSPSIGAAWVISKEDFFKDNVKFVDFLKLKANYGIAGDDRVGQRLWQERYLIGLNDGYLFGSNNGIGLNPGVLPNPFITWEKKETFNAGIEASLFNGKLDLGVEVFRNRIFDGFDGGVDKLYPMYAGFKSATVNYREVYNWGSEFNVGYKANLNKDLRLSANMNFSFGNSVVYRELYNPNELSITTGEDIIMTGLDPRRYNTGNMGLISTGMLRTQEEVDEFLLKNPNYTFRGIIPEAGWLTYEDTNKDGIISELDMVPMYDRIAPFLSTGISLNLAYKDLSLSTNIAARFGGKVFYDSRSREDATLDQNVLTIWRDRWTPDNPTQGKMPRYDDPSIGVNSTFWAVDGTMIRVNNMTLSYRVPARLAGRLGLGNARIMATGNNLWTIVNPLKYKDPYTSGAFDYPTIRTISLGLSVNF